jgi:hypothetical protein
MSNYSSAYRTPFDAENAPSRGSDPRDDDFRQTSPQLIGGSGQPVTGFVGLESKWKLWDPGGHITFAGVDPVRRMALLQVANSPFKHWAGLVQPMPIPALIPQDPGDGDSPAAAFFSTLDYTVYCRTIVADVIAATPDGSHAGVMMGLVLGEDLLGQPDTSQLMAAGLSAWRGGDFYASTAQCGPALAVFSAFDSLPTTMLGGSGLMTGIYTRARVHCERVKQDEETPEQWATTIHADFSTDGVGWVRMGKLEIEAPIRHAGFGLYGGSVIGLASFTDLFRIDLHQNVDDVLKAIGGSTELGAV